MSVPPNRMAGFRAKLGQLINGVPSPYLSPEEQAAASQQRRMAMIASLMQNSAPTPQGMGPGAFGAVGAALNAGQQAQGQSVEDAIRMRMLRAQMAQYQQGAQDPSVIREMRALGYPLTQQGFQQYNAAIGSRGPQTDPLDVPIPIPQLGDLRLADGSTLTPGATYRDAQRAGARVRSTSEQQQDDRARQALGILEQLEGLATGPEGIFRQVQPGLMNRFGSAIQFGLDMLTQDDPRASQFQDKSRATVAPFIKFLGETGSLATSDVDRAIGLLPKIFPLPDTEEVAVSKIAELKEIITRGMKTPPGTYKPGQQTTLPPLPSGFTLDPE